MSPAQTYRANAAAQWAAAQAANLPRQREIYEQSAIAWEAMAARLERIHASAATNAAAKAEGDAFKAQRLHEGQLPI